MYEFALGKIITPENPNYDLEALVTFVVRWQHFAIINASNIMR